MAISDELNRIILAKADIKSALQEKGLTIGDSSTLDEYPALILEMEVGGGSDTSTIIDLIERDILSLDIPEGATKIGNNIFYGCRLLRNITIPNTVGLIGAGAFNYCELLNNLIIPNSVGAIGPKAFYQNTNLNDMVILKDTPPTLDSENVFSNSLTIYVKNAAVDAYKNAGGNWNDVSTRINPLASMSYDSLTYTVTALGRGNLELYIDASLCNSSVYTIPQTSLDTSHVIMVKSVDENLGVLDTSTAEVLVPKKEPEFFTLTCVDDNGATVGYTQRSNETYSYSTDKETWTNWDFSTPLTLEKDQKIYLKGINNGVYNTNSRFDINNGNIEVSGNILSLMYGDDFESNTNTKLKDYAFYRLFQNCTALISAENLKLPSTILSGYADYGYMFEGCTNLTTAPKIIPGCGGNCCQFMFSGCTNLTTAPELPATLLASECYTNMFLNCRSLLRAPELPATGLAFRCYLYMFYNCSNLNYIKAMFTTTPDLTGYNSLTKNWVNGVSSTGTFVMNSAATWNPEEYRDVNGIPSGWTVETAQS